MCADTQPESFCSPGLNLLELYSGICRTWPGFSIISPLCCTFCFRLGRDGAHRFSLLSGIFNSIMEDSTFKNLHKLPALFPFAGSYLHSCDPPIIHGNLTCDTIFIQHNGLIKIGSGLPPPGQCVSLYPHVWILIVNFLSAVWHRLFVNGKREK